MRGTNMFHSYLRKLAKRLQLLGDSPARRKEKRQCRLVLESLESRDVPAPLTWAGGINLPLAGGIAAVPEGTSLLTLAGQGTTSYAVSATSPTWQATATAAVQPL